MPGVGGQPGAWCGPQWVAPRFSVPSSSAQMALKPFPALPFVGGEGNGSRSSPACLEVCPGTWTVKQQAREGEKDTVTSRCQGPKQR